MNVVTPGLGAAHNGTGMSSRNAFVEAAVNICHDVNDVNINLVSIHRKREGHQTRFVKNLQEELTVDVPLVVYWDRKLMYDLTMHEYINRLLII